MVPDGDAQLQWLSLIMSIIINIELSMTDINISENESLNIIIMIPLHQ